MNKLQQSIKRIAIIPARSGSKGLKDKNIKHLKGKPLLTYSVDAAIKSNKYDQASTKTLTGLVSDAADFTSSTFAPWLLLPQNMVTSSDGYNTKQSEVSGTDPDLATSYIALDMEIRNYNGSTVEGVVVSRQ